MSTNRRHKHHNLSHTYKRAFLTIITILNMIYVAGLRIEACAYFILKTSKFDFFKRFILLKLNLISCITSRTRDRLKCQTKSRDTRH